MNLGAAKAAKNDEFYTQYAGIQLGHDAKRTLIYKLSEMDADHVTAWSKGGATGMENCQMLCRSHNRAKGNK